MSKLPTPIRDALVDPMTRERFQKIRSGVILRARLPGSRPQYQRLKWVLVPTAIVLLGLSSFGMWNTFQSPTSNEQPQRLTLMGGGELGHFQTHDERLLIRLSDGSIIRLHQHSTLETLSNTHGRVEFELDRGMASFHVVPEGPRQWKVRSSSALMEVVGTDFRVQRDDDVVTVFVMHGRVRVTSPYVENGDSDRHTRVLTDGQQLVLGPSEPEQDGQEEQEEQQVASAGSQGEGVSSQPTVSDEQQSTSDVAPPNQAARASLRGEQEGARQGRSKTIRAAWREKAAQGEYREAYNMLGRHGFAREMRRSQSAAELMMLADVARLSGHPRDAVAPLEGVLGRFPSDVRAPVAAFTLGRLQADVLRNHNRAAAAFERSIALGAPSALRQRAYYRLAISLSRTGSAARSRDVARRYLRFYPQGRHTEEMERLAQ